ncbi:MAG: response regulator [Candidatus Kryptoniota bacterium]
MGNQSIPQGVPQDTKRFKTLIIDDTRMVQRFVEELFKRLKFDVMVAEDGYEGLKLALSSHPDLILLDIQMPRLDGLKTLQILKSNEVTREIPVIVITGFSDRINVVSAAKLGASAVLTKPLSEEALLEKLRLVFGEEFFSTLLPREPVSKENPFGVEEKEYVEVVKNMVIDFLKYFDEQMFLLQEAANNKDVKTIRRITHDIKGTGGSFGYDEVTQLATRLNEAVHAENINWENVRDLVFELKTRVVK